MSALLKRLENLERASIGPAQMEVFLTGGMAGTDIDQATSGDRVWTRNHGEVEQRFINRVRTESAAEFHGSVIYGGLPIDRSRELILPYAENRRRGLTVTMPTLHSGQLDIWKHPARFKVLRCGRRWGKTWLAEDIACDAVVKGMRVGLFAPDYKITSEFFREIEDILQPVKRQSSIGNGIFRTRTGGRLEVWSLDNDRAGRSRKYHHALIDEAAFAKNNTMTDIWEKSISPTLLDYKGSALVMSTPNGRDLDNFFWRLCNDENFARECGGFVQFHAPTSTNPYMPAEEIERLRINKPPLVFRQEYLAEFIDWRGVAFFSEDSLLQDNAPVAPPPHCDAVYAIIDTAVKSGKRHDGTAVTFFLINKAVPWPLMVIDWDIIKVEGASLEIWLPTVFQKLEHYAKIYGARHGSLGAHIEDKASGSILLQQARNHGWNAHALDSKLTLLGKDERAISVSGYVYTGKVKMSIDAHNKTTFYNENTRNHFLEQVCGFQIGVPDQPDDLLDTFCYGVSFALGDSDGI